MPESVDTVCRANHFHLAAAAPPHGLTVWFSFCGGASNFKQLLFIFLGFPTTTAACAGTQSENVRKKLFVHIKYAVLRTTPKLQNDQSSVTHAMPMCAVSEGAVRKTPGLRRRR